MAKPARGKNGHRPAPTATLDDSVGELMELADRDVSNHRLDTVGQREERRQRALSDRGVFDQIAGKMPAKRRDMQQADERAGIEAEEPEEEEEEIDPEDERETDPDDPEEEGEEGEAAEATPTRRSKELDRAINALKRVKAPAWVFKEGEAKVLELAESLSDFQRNTDDAIRRRDETIGALSKAIDGKGSRTKADEENPAQGNAEDDLDESATALVRAMDEADPDARKKALVDFGKKTRGQSGKVLAKQVGELQSALRDLVVDQATSRFRRRYPDLASDPDSEQRFQSALVAQAGTGRYGSNTTKLADDAALIEFGPPKRRKSASEARDGDAPRRKPSAPAMHTRAPERSSRVLDEGTEGHDRSVYERVMKKERSGFAVRR